MPYLHDELVFAQSAWARGSEHFYLGTNSYQLALLWLRRSQFRTHRSLLDLLNDWRAHLTFFWSAGKKMTYKCSVHSELTTHAKAVSLVRRFISRPWWKSMMGRAESNVISSDSPQPCMFQLSVWKGFISWQTFAYFPTPFLLTHPETQHRQHCQLNY